MGVTGGHGGLGSRGVVVAVGLWGRVESSGRGTMVSLGGRGVVGCELCGFGFWWVIRWWSPLFGGILQWWVWLWWLVVVGYGSDLIFILFYLFGFVGMDLAVVVMVVLLDFRWWWRLLCYGSLVIIIIFLL